MKVFSVSALSQVLADAPMPAAFLVAYSGGLDSTVLLHAAASLRASQPELQLRALHVNHGLQPGCDDWQQHCERFAATLGVDCESVSVSVGLAESSELGVEAAARRARYGVFADRLAAGECLLLAHHADDQLETMLLRLMRGAGTRGMAGMPPRRKLGRGELRRPLLGWPREALAAYAGMHGLPFIEDPSNALTQADRNHLRHDVVPMLKRRWPAAAGVATRNAQQLGEDAALLGELARLDLDEHLGCAEVPVARLCELPEARAANALRHALMALALPVPPRRRLSEALRQVRSAGRDRQVLVRWQGAQLRREGETVWLLGDLPMPPTQRVGLSPQRPLIDACGELCLLPWEAGRDDARACVLSASDVQAGLHVAYRQGGERLRQASAGARGLARVLGAAHVPVWLRDRLPLVFVDDEVVAIADWRATVADTTQPPLRSGWQLRWTPAESLRPGLTRLDRPA
ncbi:MAG: tRNA lysidine(34) synthetase TilS [Gammaproteobacteria bacterium]|nr:tRNA lysidine(34) synthetase TilS [Gammaproteobacteria bacterium]